MFGFFFWSWLTAALLAFPAGVLGCFIFWRRLAFVADALAHASLLGLGLAFIFQFNPLLGLLAVSLLMCLFLWQASQQTRIANDAMLSIGSHFLLGLGIVVISLAELRIDLLSYLLGEWLAIGRQEAIIQAIVSLLILLVLWRIHRPLLAVSAQSEIARVEGVSQKQTEMLFLLVLALFICFAVQNIGLILLNTLMIMPAATVRLWVRSPYPMMLGSVVIALTILSLGLFISLHYDVPASPAAAVVGGVLFFASWLTSLYRPSR